MSKLKLSTILSRLDACGNARTWAANQPDLQTAWTNCKRSDWMIWLLARTSLDQNDPRLRLMACDFAEAALVYAPAGEDRPRRAIEVARAFARGEATREEMAAARAAAGAAAGAAAWAAAGDAAGPAAGDAAGDAARAAARDAAGDAAWDAARDAQSDIIRGYFPECPPIEKSLLRKVS